MSTYGFDDEDDGFVPPQLPKRKGEATRDISKAIEAGNKLGFVSREGEGKTSDRRQINKEPQGKILVTGPERVIAQIRQLSIEANQPYWRVIKSLMERSDS